MLEAGLGYLAGQSRCCDGTGQGTAAGQAGPGCVWAAGWTGVD